MRPRLYLDEDVAPELARMLRDRGYDAVSAHEIGTLGLADADHLERATREGRVLFTYNFHDFLPISQEWFRAGRSHAGIIISYRQYARHEVGTLCRTVVATVEALTEEVLQDSVFVLDQFGRGRRE